MTDDEFDIDDNAPITAEEVVETNNDAGELISRIIDTFEDFLWVHHVDLHNTEPRGADEEDLIIYGRDYDSLVNDLFYTINNTMYG